MDRRRLTKITIELDYVPERADVLRFSLDENKEEMPEWALVLLSIALGSGVALAGSLYVTHKQLEYGREALQKTIESEYGKLHREKQLSAYQDLCASLVVLPDAIAYSEQKSEALSPKKKVAAIYTAWYRAYPFLVDRPGGAKDVFQKEFVEKDLLNKDNLTYHDVIDSSNELIKAATEDIDFLREMT